MKKSIYAILPLLLLASCSNVDPLPEVTSGNNISYTQDYSIDTSFLMENTNTLTGDKKQDTVNYLISNGGLVTTANKSEDDIRFITSTQTLGGREFRMALECFVNRENTPVNLVCDFYKDDRDTLPDQYFYFALLVDFDDFQGMTFETDYCYDYVDSETSETNYTSVPINYDEIQFGSCPNYEASHFTIGTGDAMPSRGANLSDEELGATGFECIRVATVFFDAVLKAVSSDYSAW